MDVSFESLNQSRGTFVVVVVVVLRLDSPVGAIVIVAYLSFFLYMIKYKISEFSSDLVTGPTCVILLGSRVHIMKKSHENKEHFFMVL